MRNGTVSVIRKTLWGVITTGVSAGLMFAGVPAAHAEGLSMWFEVQDDCINTMREYMNAGWTVDPSARCFYDIPTNGYPLTVYPPS